MSQLAHLRGDNFRLFQALDMQPHPRFNLVVGHNAAGKTSLLEAIYCLGRAKSFRGNSPSELAGKAGRHWRLNGQFRKSDQPSENIGMQWQPDGLQIRIGAQSEPRVSDLVRAWPVQVIEPTMHRLLQDGPGYRRSFLDWGVFHVEHSFFTCWRRNQRALRQRNRALRSGANNAVVSSWNAELAETANALSELRSKHLQQLLPYLAHTVPRIFGDLEWSVELYAGWSKDAEYLLQLEQQLHRDRRMGMTVDGAHRAELRLKIDQAQVKNRISRGQQKLLIAALVLAQAQLIHHETHCPPLLLVDDFAAELAPGFQAVFLDMLTAYAGQVFMTSFEAPPALGTTADFRMFHVEHGVLSQC